MNWMKSALGGTRDLSLPEFEKFSKKQGDKGDEKDNNKTRIEICENLYSGSFLGAVCIVGSNFWLINVSARFRPPCRYAMFRDIQSFCDLLNVEREKCID